ncbi:MAG TPA: hypothetical protein VNQ74_08370, partial [Burkholderiaceae bacterium]|nr:hypothetical protein [Burkholderiaceae bacterium]
MFEGRRLTMQPNRQYSRASSLTTSRREQIRPTGTVTLSFSDIDGSTRLLRSIGVQRYESALAQHRLLLRNAFAPGTRGLPTE